MMWLARDAHDAPREGVIASRHARRAALPARRRAARPARRALERRRRARGRSAARSTDGSCSHPPYPDALVARVVGAHLPDLRRGAAVGGARAMSSSTGVARRTSAAAATARCTPRTRSARSSSAASSCPSASRRSGRSVMSRRSCSGISVNPLASRAPRSQQAAVAKSADGGERAFAEVVWR